jgi:hypothetical protein
MDMVRLAGGAAAQPWRVSRRIEIRRKRWKCDESH